jgi:hypothetical protein
MLIDWKDWGAPRLCFATTEGDGNAGGGGEAPPASTEGAPAATGAEATALGGGTEATEGEHPVSWREDWREALAGSDDAALRHLKRFASPENFSKSYRDLQKRLTSGSPALPEDATPEEVAAYDKQMGIPEAPEGYKLSFPQEMGATEADTATLAAFQQHMKAAHVPPAAAKAAFDFYMKRMGETRAEFGSSAQEANLSSIAELRGEWKGREYTRNMGLAQEFLAKHFEGSDEALEQVLSARLPSGVQIGNYAPFVKGIVAMARSYADDEALIGGDGAGGGKSIDEEIADLNKKAVTTKLSKSEDARLDELYTARLRREERGRAA